MKSLILGRPSQVIQVSTDGLEQCIQVGRDGYVHKANIKNSRAWSNACWRCGGIGHFHKDCMTTLPSQDGGRKDHSLSDTNPTIGPMSHTQTASTVTTDFTFKALLKELVQPLAIK